jgi:hypothetical protein
MQHLLAPERLAVSATRSHRLSSLRRSEGRSAPRERIGPRSHRQSPAKPVKISLRTRKPERNYVMRKLTPTLTQSGLLAVLLKHQRYKVFQLARRRARRKQMRAALWSTLTWPWRVLTAPKLLSDSAEPLAEALRRRTFLRVAPSGTALHFGANGVQRVYR